MSSQKQEGVFSGNMILLVACFICGIGGAVITDLFKSRFIGTNDPVVFVRVQEFLGEQVELYGKEAGSEEDRIFLARSFSNSMEKALKEMAVEYNTAILTDPAILSGGIDVTDSLRRRVAEKMANLQ